MKKKPKIFISLDDELASQLIGRAERTVIYAAPSISDEIVDGIVKKRDANPGLLIRVIIDADTQTLRLGFGKLGGLKMLHKNGIDVRCARALRIGVLLVDDRSWIFPPTPEIILDTPSPETRNAINVTASFTKWLLHPMSPKEGYLQIARELIDERNLWKVSTPSVRTTPDANVTFMSFHYLLVGQLEVLIDNSSLTEAQRIDDDLGPGAWVERFVRNAEASAPPLLLTRIVLIQCAKNAPSDANFTVRKQLIKDKWLSKLYRYEL